MAGTGSRRRLNPVPDTPGRAVLYVRVSALMGRGGDDFHSPDLQVEAMRKAVTSAGLREAGVVDDIDISGRDLSRAGIDKIRAMVEQQQVDVVAVYDLARLGRNLAESLTFIAWLRERGVSVISTQEKIDDTPEGQFMLGQFLNMAELYSNQIGRRWAQVVDHRARQGYHHSGCPTGYRYQRDADGHPVKGAAMQIDPVVGPLITAAFEAFDAGTKISAVAQAVADGRGKPLSIITMRRILSNPVYTGKVALWGIGRHRRPNPHDLPAFVGPGKHEPLIDEATFERVLARLRRNSYTPSRRLALTHPLVGLVFCALCGYHLQLHNDPKGTTVGGHRVPVAHLQCRQRKGGDTRGRNCPGPGRPRVDDVTGEVLRLLGERIGRMSGDQSERAADLARRTRAGSDAAVLDTERGQVRQALSRLVDGWLAGRVPESVYDDKRTELETQERALSERIEQARSTAQDLTFESFATAGELLLRLWPDAVTGERNEMLRGLVSRVTIRRAAFWREPVADRMVVEFR